MANEREPVDVTNLTRPPDKRALGFPLGCLGLMIILGIIGALIYFSGQGQG
jgi:hypothetical protein